MSIFFRDSGPEWLPCSSRCSFTQAQTLNGYGLWGWEVREIETQKTHREAETEKERGRFGRENAGR